MKIPRAPFVFSPPTLKLRDRGGIPSLPRPRRGPGLVRSMNGVAIYSGASLDFGEFVGVREWWKGGREGEGGFGMRDGFW